MEVVNFFLMVDKDVSRSVNISLYESQINKVEQFLNHNKKFKSVSAFFQELIDDFFRTDNRSIFKDFMIYLGYPVVLMSLMLYVAAATDSVNKILINKGFFYSDLTNLSNMFYIIGFLFLGITIASVYFLWSKVQSEYKVKQTRKIKRARRNRK